MEENKIPTAKEYWDNSEENFQDMSLGRNEFPTRVMIEFAKLHVEAALKEASEKAMLKIVNTEEFKDIEEGEDLVDSYECGSDVILISVNSILNAYPESNIK